MNNLGAEEMAWLCFWIGGGVTSSDSSQSEQVKPAHRAFSSCSSGNVKWCNAQGCATPPSWEHGQFCSLGLMPKGYSYSRCLDERVKTFLCCATREPWRSEAQATELSNALRLFPRKCIDALEYQKERHLVVGKSDSNDKFKSVD